MTATLHSPRITPELVREVFAPPEQHPGMLISIVGFDGSGKTTQLEAVAEVLRARGREVVVTKQPTDWYRELGEVRTFHDAGGSSATARVLALLAAADRLRHIHEVVNPALRRGAVVLCDRYVYATYGVFIHRGVDAAFLTTINHGVPRPDFAFYLKMSPEQLASRLRARDGNALQFEERSLDRIASITRTYDEMAEELLTVDGSLPPEVVTDTLLRTIDQGR
ncbi:dTMP kinase [Nocardia sp. JMUB6875]|uniref:dTMP kinase n=1 Tax=Nocardia sp. JMUB6875 TaxID=3158170 RepID=UPI0032E72809